MPPKTKENTRRPYILDLPDVIRAPLIFSSPHSGRNYPQELMSQTALKLRKLRSLEDCYVDELFDHVLDHGAPFIKAELPRAFLDLNREPYELDPKLIRPNPPGFANTKSLRVKAGLGTIPRIVADGSPIYRAPVMLPDAMERIENYHIPYHDELERLIDASRKKFGIAVLLDCHSMPSSNNLYQNNITTDIVIGNRFDASCALAISRLIAEGFKSFGLTVKFNHPYAGGYITERHGQPGNNIHALQIELNRSLYLDQITLEKTEGFKTLQKNLTRITAMISAKLGDFGEMPLAAE